jgi:transketolase
MAAILNGMAVHGGLIPYGGTFLVFSDYLRPALRLSALSHYPTIWIFTHDSIGVGEDGPTHQPVEHFAALRAIPGLIVMRPADANEVVEAWKFAIARRDGPTALLLTRQGIPTLDRKYFAPASGTQRGAYVLKDLGEGNPDLILMASGSEVSLIIEAGIRLNNEGINVRIVSFPSWEMFAAQDEGYKKSVLPPEIHARLSIEAGIAQGWHHWVGDTGVSISIERFGASAPGSVVFEKFGISAQNVVSHAKELLQRESNSS